MSEENLDCTDEVFEDAEEDAPPVDLHAAMRQASVAVSLFFNNNFKEAQDLLRPWADRSMYHALGNGTFMFLQAILTFEPTDIAVASEALKQSVDVCGKFRRKQTLGESLGKMVKRTDYSGYTEEEVHAELCYAEALLLKATLNFIEDETLMSFVKGGIKIRSCYQSYKQCWYMLDSRTWLQGEEKKHFESGVRMGVGSFNLLISQLPNKILKLLEFVGFSGNKSCQHVGLSELQKGYALEGSLRRVLCALVLLGSHLVFSYVLGTADGDLVLAESILNDQLRLYPNGALFLFFAGRLQYVKAEFAAAEQFYRRSWAAQDQWRQFHHVCYWELTWTAIMTTDWRTAEKYTVLLQKESRWSRATYGYIRACCMCMRDLTKEEGLELQEIMKSIPGLRQRIAGKSLPFEKLAAKKAARFLAQGNRLTLAGLELIYMWNGFRILGTKHECVDRMLVLVERERARLERLPQKEQGACHTDDLLLCLLLKGCCLAHMALPLQAAECFSAVAAGDKKIKEDKYLVPCALLECASLSIGGPNEDLPQARSLLEFAKNQYKGYSLESRVHFRLHGQLTKVAALEKAAQLSKPPTATALSPTSLEPPSYPGLSRPASPMPPSEPQSPSPAPSLNIPQMFKLNIRNTT